MLKTLFLSFYLLLQFLIGSECFAQLPLLYSDQNFPIFNYTGGKNVKISTTFNFRKTSQTLTEFDTLGNVTSTLYYHYNNELNSYIFESKNTFLNTYNKQGKLEKKVCEREFLAEDFLLISNLTQAYVYDTLGVTYVVKSFDRGVLYNLQLVNIKKDSTGTFIHVYKQDKLGNQQRYYFDSNDRLIKYVASYIQKGAYTKTTHIVKWKSPCKAKVTVTSGKEYNDTYTQEVIAIRTYKFDKEQRLIYCKQVFPLAHRSRRKTKLNYSD